MEAMCDDDDVIDVAVRNYLLKISHSYTYDDGATWVAPPSRFNSSCRSYSTCSTLARVVIRPRLPFFSTF